MRVILPILAAIGTVLWAAPASAEFTVECLSHSYKYNECGAGPLNEPVLIHQTSNAACILNRTWGFDPSSNNIWVNAGCSGVFADNQGYHHGKSNTYDNGARNYDSTGHDDGAWVVGAALLGVVLATSIEEDNKKHHKGKDHYSSNRYNYDGEGYTVPNGYNGCHGVGCYVDDPDN